MSECDFLKYLNKTTALFDAAIPAEFRPRLNGEAIAVGVRLAFIKDPKLGQAHPTTVKNAILSSLAIGINPVDGLGLSYLTTRWNGKNQRLECVLVIGYKGYLELLHRSDAVDCADAFVVYSNDVVDYDRGAFRFSCRPGLPDRGEPLYAIAVAYLKDSNRAYTNPMTMDDWHNRVLEGGPRSIHRKHRDQMWSKAALKGLMNRLPKSVSVMDMDQIELENEYAAYSEGQRLRVDEEGNVSMREPKHDRIAIEERSQRPAIEEKVEETTLVERPAELVRTTDDLEAMGRP